MNDRRMRPGLPDVPDGFTSAIYQGRERIRRYERRRKAVQRAALSAAGLLLIAGMSVALRSGIPAVRDQVTHEGKGLPVVSEVLAHPDDVYYHRNAECEQCIEEAVQMPLDTALEFDKQPCPECMEGST